jgi:hypothetical protein
MLFFLCFCYCFFAIVLGLYLGFELISVRKAERLTRTIFRAAQAAKAVPPPLSPEAAPAEPAQPNYFTMK